MLIIYTDGSCLHNPGPGGWAYLVVDGVDGNMPISGGSRHSTNNVMEMTAVLNALNRLPDGTAVEIRTDSTYVQLGMTSWLAKWKQRNWRGSHRAKVANVQLWQQLDCHAKRLNVTWTWVRGHNGDPANEAVDKAARSAAAKFAEQA